jgi:hypothetical protein
MIIPEMKQNSHLSLIFQIVDNSVTEIRLRVAVLRSLPKGTRHERVTEKVVVLWWESKPIDVLP